VTMPGMLSPGRGRLPGLSRATEDGPNQSPSASVVPSAEATDDMEQA
jgi:hypothetical protein